VIIYYFSEAQTTQTTLPNGPNVKKNKKIHKNNFYLIIQIYKFANNQIEIHHPDGSKEIK
jgi:hypothetical protein